MLWYFFYFPKPCFRLVLTVLVWKLSYCRVECTFGGIQYLLCAVYDTSLIHKNNSISCNLCICTALNIPVNIAPYCTEKLNSLWSVPTKFVSSQKSQTPYLKFSIETSRDNSIWYKSLWSSSKIAIKLQTHNTIWIMPRPYARYQPK